MKTEKYKCPRCGQDDILHLWWNDDDDGLYCDSCGHQYFIVPWYLKLWYFITRRKVIR